MEEARIERRRQLRRWGEMWADSEVRPHSKRRTHICMCVNAEELPYVFHLLRSFVTSC